MKNVEKIKIKMSGPGVLERVLGSAGKAGKAVKAAKTAGTAGTAGTEGEAAGAAGAEVGEESVGEASVGEASVGEADEDELETYKNHEESGLCDSATSVHYYPSGHQYHELAQGDCKDTVSCNFCCGLTAKGPDGSSKKYGPHCRQGQCGTGQLPNTMMEGGKDQKSSWTDCPV